MKLRLEHISKIRDVNGAPPCRRGLAWFERNFPRGIELDQDGLNKLIKRMTIEDDYSEYPVEHADWLLEALCPDAVDDCSDEELLAELFIQLEKFLIKNEV